MRDLDWYKTSIVKQPLWIKLITKEMIYQFSFLITINSKERYEHHYPSSYRLNNDTAVLL